MSARRYVDARSLTEEAVPNDVRTHLARRARYGVTMRWFDMILRTSFDDEAAAALFARRYARFAAEGPAHISGFAVRDGDGAAFWLDGGAFYRCPGPLGSVPIAFLADIVVRERYFESVPDASFHAAAIGCAGVAVAVSAASESGKTTTAVATLRRGLDLFSDERCIVRDGRVLPFPRALNLRSGGIELLLGERVPGDDALHAALRDHRGGHWEAVDFAALQPGWTPPRPAPLVAIFFITGRGAAPSAEPLAFDTALRMLLDQGLRSSRRGLDRAAEASAMLRRAQPYALSLGTPDATAALLEATCRGAGASAALARRPMNGVAR